MFQHNYFILINLSINISGLNFNRTHKRVGLNENMQAGYKRIRRNTRPTPKTFYDI